MQFYKVTATLIDEKWSEENNDYRVRDERKRKIMSMSEEFNQRNGDECFCFVSTIRCNVITCGIISVDCADMHKKLNDYFKTIKVKVRDIKTDEITFGSICSLLTTASHGDYINDYDEVLERFELDRINGRHFRGIEFGENLLDSYISKISLYETSAKLLAEKTMNPELDRIFKGKRNTKAFGHPVHYFIETDDRDTRKVMYYTLLQALYANDRLKSRRYCFVDFKPGQDFSRIVYDSLYKSCIGGAMVVRYLSGDDSDDNEYASVEFETVSVLCETMMKYRNQVLTVFCLPRACEKTKLSFMENLGNIGMVEIKEDLAFGAQAVEYLKMLSKNRHIRPDKKLYGKLDFEKHYLPDELRTIFHEWYNHKMRTSVFPQYKDIQVCRKEAIKEAAHGSAYDNLNEMIGLASAKSVIGKALNYYKLQRIYSDKGIKQDRPAMHMVFTGNPGTAKTTVARLFARIMKENGLLSKGQLVEVGRGDLVGKYVGWTAQIVQNKFKEAMGGVLFVDEAYSLVEDRSGSYGDEAINTIVQEMENRRQDLIVIFAGYPEKMETFLQKNPGLRSRIAFHIPFEDYSTEELCEIACLIGKHKGITMSEDAMEKLSGVFDAARRQPDFGNGRYVRNILEISRMNQAGRIVKMDPADITLDILTTIIAEDIDVPDMRQSSEKTHIIGFAS